MRIGRGEKGDNNLVIGSGRIIGEGVLRGVGSTFLFNAWVCSILG